jgi:hypothetical protein
MGKKRLVIALVVIVALGVGGGLWFWLNQDDAGPDRSGPAFPDLDALGLDAGSAELCATLGRTMTARGYQQVDAPSQDRAAATCRFITSGLSFLADGSHSLNVDFAVWRGDAERRYGIVRDDVTGHEVTPWPVGDVGFVGFWQPSEQWSELRAVSRSGNDVVAITLWGAIQRGSVETEALAEGVARDEITDILRALSGDGKPGKSRIVTPQALEQAPYLTDLTAPRLPALGPSEEACAAFGDIAGKTGTQEHYDKADLPTEGYAGPPTYTCRFATPDPDHTPEEDLRRVVEVEFITNTEDWFRVPTFIAWDMLADGETPQYELPVGNGGYASYTDNPLGYSDTRARYVVNGTTYVTIHIRDKETRDEETALRNLATLLT